MSLAHCILGLSTNVLFGNILLSIYQITVSVFSSKLGPEVILLYF